MERMPDWVPTSVLDPPRRGRSERSSSSWSAECANGKGEVDEGFKGEVETGLEVFLGDARTSITERVPSPLEQEGIGPEFICSSVRD